MSADNKKPRTPAPSDATGALTPDDLAKMAQGKATPAVSDATGSFTPDDLARMKDGTVVLDGSARPAPAVSDATGSFTPDDLARMASGPVAQPRPAPAVSDATGAFTPDDLARMEGKQPVSPPPSDSTGVFTPADLARFDEARTVPPPVSGATGAFTPDDLSRMPTDTILSEGQRSAGNDSAVWGATGEFTLDGDQVRPAGTHHGGNVGMATGGQGGGRMTSPAAPGAFPPVAPKVRAGRYSMKKFHARGGMGEVWLAEDCDINRPVALKKVRPGMAKEMQERFLIEAQITGQLEHPGIIPVHELGADESGQPFYAMRFVRGRTMEDAIAAYHAAGEHKDAREVELLRLLQVFLTLCQTVAYAHSRGVIHRDLKPDNVMVGEFGETLLLDWGLAKVLGQPDPDADLLKRTVSLPPMSEATQTIAGSVKGTPGYMPPESAEGLNEEVDELSDVYLLGAILYHLLTGRPPRTGTSLLAILKDAMKKPVPPPRTIKADVPKPLDGICQKAIAFKKADRYPSAQAMAEDLQRYLAGEPVSAYRETFTERTWRWVNKHRQMLTWSAAAALVLLTVSAGAAKWYQLEQKWAREREAAAELAAEQQRDKEAAEAKAEQLKKEEEARGQIKQFQRLADELRFYAATPDPAGEQAPPLVDLESGDKRGRDALKVAAAWGPQMQELPLPDQRAVMKAEKYDLLLLMAQTLGRRASTEAAGREMLALLEQAEPLGPTTASYHRLSAQAHKLVGDKAKAEAQQKLAADPKTRMTALDHYLAGLALQLESMRPADADAQGDAGKAAREKLVRRAIEHYNAALRLEPKHYWAHMNLASSYLNLGERARAAEALNACVALDPKAPWGYSTRGLARVAEKRFGEAIVDLDTAIDLSKDFDFRLPRLNRGIAYWIQQKYDKALEDFNAVDQPPDDKRLIEGAYYRGQVHLEREQFADALAAFDKVVAARRAFLSLHLFRARCLLAQGAQAEAEGKQAEAQRKQAEAQGKQAEAQRKQAEAQRKLAEAQRKLAEALAAMDTFLAGGQKYDPEAGESYGRRGRLLRLVMVPKLPPKLRPKVMFLARAQLEKAVELGGASAHAYEDLGAMQELLGQTDKAVASYSEALKLAPEDVKIQVKRGWARADLKPPQFEEARDDFEAVLKREPTHAEAYAGLGYVLACLKMPVEARRAANRSLLLGGGDYLVLHNVACAYAKLAQNVPEKEATEFEDLVMDYLRRAVELWRRGGTGPDEIKLIKTEPAFHARLRARKDFQELITPRDF